MLEELEDEQMLVQEQLWEDEREELEEVDLRQIDDDELEFVK